MGKNKDNFKRLYTAWGQCGVALSDKKRDLVEKMWKRLKNFYGDRPYHNLAHINRTIGILDDISDKVEDKDAMVIALFYHDAIYKPGKDNNEALSGLMFERDAETLGLPKNTKDKISRLILSTMEGFATETNDEQFIYDIDRTALADKHEIYMLTSNAIREEFGKYGDEAYFKGRRHFLMSMLEKEHVYKTNYFRAFYEGDARRNMEMEVRWIDDFVDFTTGD